MTLALLAALTLTACGCGTSDGDDQALGTGGASQSKGELQITTESVPAGVPGVAYDATQLTADGALGPVSWDLAGGQLPPGMRLTDDGRVVGTPGATGYYEFTTRARDGVQEDARTLAIAVDVLGLTITDGLYFGDAWSNTPVTVRAAGARGSVRFDAPANGSRGRFLTLDGASGIAIWLPGLTDVRGTRDVLRATDAATGESLEVEFRVVPDPLEDHGLRMGTTDAWMIDFGLKQGRHAFASDFHAALARVGLRSPLSTTSRGREVDALVSLLVQREVLRELNEMYLRERDGSEGARGLAISFDFERPGAGYSEPAPGSSRPARQNGYNVMVLCDQSASRGAYGVAFLDRLGNPNQEHNASGGPAGEMGVFVNIIAESVARTYRLHGDELQRNPLADEDLEVLKALLHGQPSTGYRFEVLAYQVRAFARSLACVLAHEIAHSLGASHLEAYVPGAIMNGVGVIGPGTDYYFTAATLEILRAGLRGSGGGSGAAEPGVAALGVPAGVHVCGHCQDR